MFSEKNYTLESQCAPERVDRVTPQKVLNIPIRRVQIDDLNQIPNSYSSTPGGTLFSTTPGGTRIIYERSFLIKMRNSPIAKTSPKNLPYIAGITNISPENGKENKIPVTCDEKNTSPVQEWNNKLIIDKADKKSDTLIDEPQFSMDM